MSGLNDLFGGISRTIGLTEDGPSRESAQLDQQAQSLINDKVNETNANSAEQIAAKKNSGLLGAQQLSSRGASKDIQTGVGGDTNLAKALENRYSAMTRKELDKVKMANEASAQGEYGNKLARAYGMANARKSLEAEALQKQIEADNQAQQARAAVIGSIFQAGGAVAGAYLGRARGGSSPAGGASGDFSGGGEQFSQPSVGSGVGNPRRAYGLGMD